MIDGLKPWAEKPGDPHLHRCGCGHSYVAPYGDAAPCPSCTDKHGHNYLDRQVLAIARGAIDRYGIDAVLRDDATAFRD